MMAASAWGFGCDQSVSSALVIEMGSGKTL
jgi:hypothetical protein